MRTRVPAIVWIVVVLVVLDQVTKAMIFASIALYDSVTVIPGLLNLVHVRNEGVAFGMLNAVDLPYKPLLTAGLALLATAGIGLYYTQLQPDERLARLGLSGILAGALGNLIDRLQHGYVLDFVDVHWGEWHFWAFNVADAAISIGAVLVFADLLLVKRHVSDSV